ncbi:phosphatidate cytidylyltransferase [Erysipelotrichaceae bacterium OttesenSCG-928-M19]|nr:phosphatidate cytidylyltransferase [Erysipelotrichaceae bacterium OttesenSCG-928-M19]
MRSRVITALLILGVLLPVIYLSAELFKFVGIIIVAIATHELLEVKKERDYAFLSKLVIYIVNILPLLLISDFTKVNASYIAILVLIFCALMIFDKKIDSNDMAYLLSLSLFIILASNSAMYLRSLDNGFYVVIFSILVTAASDTGAFFVGNMLGKHKLIERISPNKTIEGLIGGVILAVIVGIVYGLLLPTGFTSLVEIAFVSFVLGFGAAFGDLIFSAIKRTNKIKDFSNMLPGHGGILDRVDSHFTNLIICFTIIVLLKG